MTEEFDEWLRPDERREEVRLNSHCIVYLQIPDSTLIQSGSTDFPVEACHTLDFSTNGVQIKTTKPLVQDAILSIVVEVNGEVFSLISEVMWCRPDHQEGGFLVGLHFLVSDDSSTIEWKESMIKWLEIDS